MTAVQAEPITPLMTFAAKVREHDPSFFFSDDRRVYEAGHRERDALLDLAADLPKGEVMAIVELRVTPFFPYPEDLAHYLFNFSQAIDRRRDAVVGGAR
ncbi:MAG: hypothetical protein AB7O32_04900 [Vicinamibacterales bacterium]